MDQRKNSTNNLCNNDFLQNNYLRTKNDFSFRKNSSKTKSTINCSETNQSSSKNSFTKNFITHNNKVNYYFYPGNKIDFDSINSNLSRDNQTINQNILTRNISNIPLDPTKEIRIFQSICDSKIKNNINDYNSKQLPTRTIPKRKNRWGKKQNYKNDEGSSLLNKNSNSKNCTASDTMSNFKNNTGYKQNIQNLKQSKVFCNEKLNNKNTINKSWSNFCLKGVNKPLSQRKKLIDKNLFNFVRNSIDNNVRNSSQYQKQKEVIYSDINNNIVNNSINNCHINNDTNYANYYSNYYFNNDNFDNYYQNKCLDFIESNNMIQKLKNEFNENKIKSAAIFEDFKYKLNKNIELQEKIISYNNYYPNYYDSVNNNLQSYREQNNNNLMKLKSKSLDAKSVKNKILTNARKTTTTTQTKNKTTYSTNKKNRENNKKNANKNLQNKLLKKNQLSNKIMNKKNHNTTTSTNTSKNTTKIFKQRNNTEKDNNDKNDDSRNKCVSVDIKKIQEEKEYRKKILNEQINNILGGNVEIKNGQNELQYYNDLFNVNKEKKQKIINELFSRDKEKKDCNEQNCIYHYDNINLKATINSQNINKSLHLKYMYKPGSQTNLDLNKEIHKNLPSNNSELNLNIGGFNFTRKFNI